VFRDHTQTSDCIIMAPVIRALGDEEYPRRFPATVFRVKAITDLPAWPNLLCMPIPGTYLRLLPILPPS